MLQTSESKVRICYCAIRLFLVPNCPCARYTLLAAPYCPCQYECSHQRPSSNTAPLSSPPDLLKSLPATLPYFHIYTPLSSPLTPTPSLLSKTSPRFSISGLGSFSKACGTFSLRLMATNDLGSLTVSNLARSVSMTCFQSLWAVRERRAAKPMQWRESRTLHWGRGDVSGRLGSRFGFEWVGRDGEGGWEMGDGDLHVEGLEGVAAWVMC